MKKMGYKIKYSLIVILLIGLMPFLSAYDNWTSNSSLNDGLVAYYKLDETSGTNAMDFLGINNGTNFNATIGVSGKIGTAYNFSNSFVNLSNIQLENFTISAWINIPSDSYNAYGGIVGKSNGTTSWSLDEGAIGELGGRLCSDVGGCESVTGIYPIGFDNWIFVVYTYNGTDMQLWKNDTIIGTYAKTGLQIKDNESIKVGKSLAYSSYFIGSIDEVGIWNRSLSDAEILQLYNDYAGNSPQQIIIEEPIIPIHQPSGVIYDVMNSGGAGLGKLFIYLGQALPLLLFGLMIVVIIIIVGYAFKDLLKSVNKIWHTK